MTHVATNPVLAYEKLRWLDARSGYDDEYTTVFLQDAAPEMFKDRTCRFTGWSSVALVIEINDTLHRVKELKEAMKAHPSDVVRVLAPKMPD